MKHNICSETNQPELAVGPGRSQKKDRANRRGAQVKQLATDQKEREETEDELKATEEFPWAVSAGKEVGTIGF